jgi:uncharacterized membrane protein YbhN (UPF0104 family)
MKSEKQDSSKSILRYLPRNRLSLVLTLLATAGLVWLFLRVASPEDIFDLFRNISLKYLFFAFLFYLLVFWARTMRLHQFRRLRAKPISDLLPAVAFHSFMNFILPSRSGELTLIYFLRRFSHVDVGSGTGFLLVSRLYDLIAMTVFFLVSFFAISPENLGVLQGRIQWIAAFFLVLLMLIALLAGTIATWIMDMLEAHHSAGGRLSGRVMDKAMQWGRGVQTVFSESRQISLSVRLFVWSLVVWLGLNGIFWALMSGMGFGSIKVGPIIIAATLAALTSVLPLTILGNWGTLQVGWTAGFVWAGLSIENAAASGFAVQLWTLLFSTSVLILNLFFRWLVRIIGHFMNPGRPEGPSIAG